MLLLSRKVVLRKKIYYGSSLLKTNGTPKHILIFTKKPPNFLECLIGPKIKPGCIAKIVYSQAFADKNFKVIKLVVIE